MTQRITKGAVTLANGTEGAARSTALKVTQAEPSHEFVAWQALVDGSAPKSSNDPAIALQPIRATRTRCKDYDGRTSHRRRIGWDLFDLKNVVSPPTGESTSPDLLPF